MKHKDLCVAACRWLVTHAKAKHAFSEFNTMCLEEFPDAIGYLASTYKGPIVIEVKVSVEDFKRDKHKGWRRNEQANLKGDQSWHIQNCGMGARRYYLVPEGLISVDDVPEDHGLLVAVADKSGKVRVKPRPLKDAPLRPRRDTGSELAILCTALDRWKRGVFWIPEEFRFETQTETDRRTNPKPLT